MLEEDMTIIAELLYSIDRGLVTLYRRIDCFTPKSDLTNSYLHYLNSIRFDVTEALTVVGDYVDFVPDE